MLFERKKKRRRSKQTSVPVDHTVDHLRSHPVGVSHHGVPLSAVGPLQPGQFTLRQLLLVLVVHHEPSQPEVCHHHCVVLHKENGTGHKMLLRCCKATRCQCSSTSENLKFNSKL